MKKLTMALAAVALGAVGMLGTAAPSSAQGIYFGVGDGYREWGGPAYYHRAPRAHVYVAPGPRFRARRFHSWDGAYARDWWGGY